MIAGKQLDLVMGVDIHIVNIPSPGGPVPTPMPHPHIGMLMDPMEYLPVVGTTVFVNGLPAAYAGAAGIAAPPHIPMGAGFTKPVDNENELFMGSATVLCCDQPMSALGHMALSCSCVGAPPPPRKGKDPGSGLLLPTSSFLVIPGGMLVMVGGPPTVSMLGLAFSFAKVGFGWLKKTKAMKKSSDHIHQAASKATKKLPENARNKVHKSICDITGHPVDIPTGKVFTDQIDLELPGPIPLQFERTWFSTSNYDGPMGNGWHHSYDLWIKDSPRDQAYQIRLEDGRNFYVPYLSEGDVHFNKQEKLRVEHRGKELVMRTKDRLYYSFDIQNISDGRKSPLKTIKDNLGNEITFQYDDEGLLSLINDSAGRDILFKSNGEGKIQGIEIPHPTKPEEHYSFLNFSYSNDGNLIQVSDVDKKTFNYEYDGHLLVKETNRNGLSFYFEYDGKDVNAKCIRTWGDEGIYERHLTYLEEKNCTLVENSLGMVTEYHWNDKGVAYKTVDAQGRVEVKRLGEFAQILSKTDPKGRTTRFEYNPEGDLIQVLYPDQSSISFSYDDHLPTGMVDQNGGTKTWTYDESGCLIAVMDQEGNEVQYEFEKGLLSTIVEPTGAKTKLSYDEHKNVSKVEKLDSDFGISWQYDTLGNPLLSSDSNSAKKKYKFDRQNRLIKSYEPDGNIRQYEYDAEGNVITYRDKHSQVQMSYTGMNKLSVRNESGKRIQFEYNTEENLDSIINEAGDRYQFERNHAGEIIKEVGFDGLQREYERDRSGSIEKSYLPNGKVISYVLDELDRITEIDHDGEKEEYEYRPDGVLIRAKNAISEVSFERDALGRVTKEENGGFSIFSKYDQFGNRVEIQTALGEKVDLYRNEFGFLNELSVGREKKRWSASYKRDEFGLELEALLPGSIRDVKERDVLGRISNHKVSTGAKTSRLRKYSWGANNRLKEIINEHGQSTSFAYDDSGFLISANYADGTEEQRVADIVGNLYKNANKTDRRFGRGGELLEDSGTQYDYDQLGNLKKKVSRTGEVWEYEWLNNGHLKSVIRPDGESVSFTYDALGRRLTKNFRGRTTRWIWDGNNILHEWEEQSSYSSDWSSEDESNTENAQIRHSINGTNRGNESTWLFDESGFAPIALLKKEEQFSIVSDHLGTPCLMYNEKGEEVWSMELSIYGEVKSLKGQKDDCPFRYPGQYEDEETGLYYNRFRYYSPESGTYISQDPIGLLGGHALYAYVHDVNSRIDPYGLNNISTGEGRAHVKYSGIKNGKPYHGYASAPLSDGLKPDEILARRYGNNFDDFDVAPQVDYYGEGIEGKRTARGLEQRGFEMDGGLPSTANRQSPVGSNNINRQNYLDAADLHMKDLSDSCN